MRKYVFKCVSWLWIMYEWQLWLMWGIRFPASQRRGCTSVAKPQHTAQPTSKGVVWTHSYTNTNSVSYTCTHTHLLIQLLSHTFALTQTPEFTQIKSRICTLSFHVNWHTYASNTHTHTHTNTQNLDFLCSQTGTHKVQCAGWWVWALGGGRPCFPHLCLLQ